MRASSDNRFSSAGAVRADPVSFPRLLAPKTLKKEKKKNTRPVSKTFKLTLKITITDTVQRTNNQLGDLILLGVNVSSWKRPRVKFINIGYQMPRVRQHHDSDIVRM
jgi:hypothetical protein